jgi:hypothetical protein
MTDLEKRILEMLRNVRNFGVTHDVAFPPGSLAHTLFDNIGNIVNDLEGFAAQQSSGRAAARQHTATKGAARDALIEDLTIISRTARALAFTTPGLEGKFRFRKNMNDQLLLDTARAFLADAEPYKADFLRHEVPAQLFQRLEANIAAFQASLVGQYEGGESSVTAATAFDANIELVMGYVRQLDAIVRNKLHNNPAGLAAWERARHVERAPRRNHKEPPDPTGGENTPPPVGGAEHTK